MYGCIHLRNFLQSFENHRQILFTCAFIMHIHSHLLCTVRPFIASNVESHSMLSLSHFLGLYTSRKDETIESLRWDKFIKQLKRINTALSLKRAGLTNRFRKQDLRHFCRWRNQTGDRWETLAPTQDYGEKKVMLGSSCTESWLGVKYSLVLVLTLRLCMYNKYVLKMDT